MLGKSDSQWCKCKTWWRETWERRHLCGSNTFNIEQFFFKFHACGHRQFNCAVTFQHGDESPANDWSSQDRKNWIEVWQECWFLPKCGLDTRLALWEFVLALLQCGVLRVCPDLQHKTCSCTFLKSCSRNYAFLLRRCHTHIGYQSTTLLNHATSQTSGLAYCVNVLKVWGNSLQPLTQSPNTQITLHVSLEKQFKHSSWWIRFSLRLSQGEPCRMDRDLTRVVTWMSWLGAVTPQVLLEMIRKCCISIARVRVGVSPAKTWLHLKGVSVFSTDLWSALNSALNLCWSRVSRVSDFSNTAAVVCHN